MDLSRHHIDEADLLALVEGEPLEPGARARVEAALARDADLAALVAAMREDRRALGNLPVDRAPVGLIDDVLAQVEREALLGMEHAAHGDMPTVIVKREGVLARLARSPWVRPAALAAGVALAAVGGWSMLRPVVQGVQRQVALAPTRAGNTAAPALSGALGDRAELDSGPANTHETLTRQDRTPTLAKTTLALATDRPDTPTASPPEPGEITPRRASELARAGRLAIRVRAATTQAGTVRVESVRVRAGRSIEIEHLSPAQSQLARAGVERARQGEHALVIANPRAVTPGVPETLASGEHRERGAGSPDDRHAPTGPAAADALNAPATATPPAYRVALAPDPALIEQLVRRLAGEGRDVRVTLTELPEPMVFTPTLTPEDLTWWTRPAGMWDRRGGAVLIIEH